MTTLQMLMAAGDDLLETRVIPGAPDWEALHGETPDDTLPGEKSYETLDELWESDVVFSSPGGKVAAADAEDAC